MGLRKLVWRLSGSCGVHWRLNRRIICWLLIFVGIGIILGCITMFNSLFTVSKIGKHLLDGNLRRAVSPTAGIGGMLFGRVSDLFLIGLMVFAVCLTNWSTLFVFPLVAFRGYCLVINLYWAFVKFGAFAGVVLFLVYLFWLIIALGLVIITTVFLMRHCAGIRRYGFKTGLRRKIFFKGLVTLAFSAAVIGFFEWLVYFFVLSRMVFLI